MTAKPAAQHAEPIHPAQAALQAANVKLRRAGDRLNLLRELCDEAGAAAEAAIVEHQAALDAWVEYLKAEGKPCSSP